MQDNATDSHRAVLVIGGGVAGIKAAMDLAESRKDVVLIDKAPSIGGLMTQLDRTFPTNNCDLCTISPNLSAEAGNQDIELLPLTRVVRLEGEAGNFDVTLAQSPRYIDLSQCTACGECHKKYPQCVRFSPGLDHRAPTCMRYPQATPQAFSIDMAACDDVDGLVACCPFNAIIPDDKETEIKRKIGAVIVAAGAELFDPSRLDHFGHSTNPNVVTGLEYERIMSASGPTLGRLERPSDKKQPKKVAWIQCAGSRGINREDVSYCSSVCCMYALKEAIVTKERFGDDIETTIFYMDMRTFGKDYERYYNRAQSQYGVRLVRCRPHSIVPIMPNQDLMISYASDNAAGLTTEDFDMVVLSTGFRPATETVQLAETLGIELNQHQFAKTPSFNPVATSKAGIYVCGVFESPKDIPETMAQASAAANQAGKHIDAMDLDQSDDDGHKYPPERDVSGEPLRLGVFVCECGQNIAGTVDVAAVVADAAKMPHVAVSQAIGHGCSAEGMEQVRKAIVDNNINRVVIGACSPRTHEEMFQETLRRAGLNKYLLEMANIRDQSAWVHIGQSELATQKAKDLVRMAAGAVVHAVPLKDQQIPINHDVLVIGGGVAGMTSALELADQGIFVVLAERNGHLGGMASLIHRTIEGHEVLPFVQDLVTRTLNHDHIEVITQAIVVDHYGMPGQFRTGFQVGPRMYYRQIDHGATILATGAMPNRPDLYLLDEHKAVVTQLDLDDIIATKADQVADWQSVVMIQCAGSRTPDNPNCSRICCQSAIKNALRLLDINPEIQLYVLYRDMRTYGFAEDAYIEARRRGIIFVRYSVDEQPRVAEAGDQVTVTFKDPVLGRDLEVTADCLTLSTGFVADDETTEELAAIFHLDRNEDGYFLESHVKLKPVEMAAPGFFVAGCAHSPKNIRETLGQAQAAAGRATAWLNRRNIQLGAVVAKVDATKCATCLACVRACPYGVPFINADRYSEIDPAKCHGCGVCAAECPAKAIQLTRFEDEPILAKLESLLLERIA